MTPHLPTPTPIHSPHLYSGGDFTILETRKDGTKFTSWRMRRAAEQLQAIEADYQNRQKALVEQARGVDGGMDSVDGGRCNRCGLPRPAEGAGGAGERWVEWMGERIGLS